MTNPRSGSRKTLEILLLIACVSLTHAHAQSPEATPKLDFDFYVEKFCLQFKQKAPELTGAIIEDMEKTPFTVEAYLRTAGCQPEAYSNAIKGPMMHLIADDPTAKEDTLRRVILYFERKRKAPELIATWINAKTTKGETLLDYFETHRLKRLNTEPEQLVAKQKLIQRLCQYGATYSYYPEKHCP